MRKRFGDTGGIGVHRKTALIVAKENVIVCIIEDFTGNDIPLTRRHLVELITEFVTILRED